MTFDFKWLRAVPHEAFTGAHTDSVYMARGTEDLVTMWTPFGVRRADMNSPPVLRCHAPLPSADSAGTNDARIVPRGVPLMGGVSGSGTTHGGTAAAFAAAGLRHGHGHHRRPGRLQLEARV